MLLYFKKKLVTDYSILAMKPLLSMAQHAGGMSHNFWKDPFILGYLHTSVLNFLKSTFSGKLKEDDLFECYTDAYSAVSSMQGNWILDQIDNFSEDEKSLFEKGAEFCNIFYIKYYFDFVRPTVNLDGKRREMHKIFVKYFYECVRGFSIGCNDPEDLKASQMFFDMNRPFADRLFPAMNSSVSDYFWSMAKSGEANA